jgi:ATP-dependent protease Clp ATPase subunit
MDQSAQYCGFCGKDRAEVRHLIAVPNVFICDACVELCRHIIESARKPVEDRPIAFLVRAPRGAVESWCVVNSATNTVPMTPNRPAD